MNWQRIGLEIGALAASILVWLGFMLLLAPLYGAPPITENPAYYLSSLVLGLLFHAVWRHWRRRAHAKTLTED
jgi:chromate transport protein ChrA